MTTTKPIFVATHPRACSTAFERVFMTRRDTVKCVHEPFGDAYYFGPERLGDRYERDEPARIASGFSESTYGTIFDRLDKEASEGKRLFIKDIAHYLVPPNGKPANIALSLKCTKQGNGADSTSDDRSLDGVNGLEEGARSGKPCVYKTGPEPRNPTVVPKALLARFHFAFLIRDPHFSIPSYYRCTIPPLRETTGFDRFDPLEAGYDELRRVFDYLCQAQLIGPCLASDGLPFNGASESDRSIEVDSSSNKCPGRGPDICVVDADDLLNNPAEMIAAFCHNLGLPYDPGMLRWDTEEDSHIARKAFDKWKGFHEDALESTGLTARNQKKVPQSEAEFDAEWRSRYGEQGAQIIRETVDRNMADYLYLKQYAMKI